MKNNVELLAPAGDFEKLKTALHFGADAVYFAGTKFGLRAFASNFSDVAIPVDYCHKLGKKAYITLNVYPRNSQKEEIIDYIKYLEKVKPDGVIVSDIGVMSLVKKYAPNVDIHVSTQANTTNLTSAETYAKVFGATRVVLARELPLADIAEISSGLKKLNVETEVFVHGAMCISYSGRCLLSNYLTGRDSNQGACAQPCRWGYSIKECEPNVNQNLVASGEEFPVEEDKNGTYILNSKDLCLANYMPELIKAGVTSFKIEGRMKSPYYIACVVNTYRKIIDDILNYGKPTMSADEITAELEKSSHRKFTTGFVVNDGSVRQNYESSHQTQTSVFVGTVLDTRKTNGKTEILVEMRNRFKVGDTLELLSPKVNNAKLTILKMTDEDGEPVEDAKKVQQKLWITFDALEDTLSNITALDILRK